jgi:hypothetical protein
MSTFLYRFTTKASGELEANSVVKGIVTTAEHKQMKLYDVFLRIPL